MRPPRSILDPRFKYRNAAETDIRKTFRKHRLLERLQRQNVTSLPKRKTA